MTFRLFYIYFLQISLLICLTKADERDHYEEDSEFADDMIEDIDLVSKSLASDSERM